MKIKITVAVVFLVCNLFANRWERLYYPVSVDENDISFATEKIGWIVGYHEVKKTVDGGKTWSLQYEDKSHSFQVIEMFDSLTGYIGGSSGAMLKTTDGGNTWEYFKCDSTSSKINNLAVISKDSLWISTDAGEIIFSADGGKTWTLQAELNTEIYSLDVKYGYGIACGKTIDDIYYTDDLINWSKANPVDISSHSYTKSYLYTAAIASDTSAVIMGWGTDVLADQPTIIIRSSNKGLDWAYQEQMNPVFTSIKDMFFMNELEGYALGGSTRFGTVVIKTVDGGITWNRLDLPLGTAGYRIDGAGSTIGIIATYGLKYVSNDSGENFFISESKPDNDFNAIELLPNGNIVIAGDNGQIAISKNGGSDWDLLFAADKGFSPHLLGLDFVNESVGYAAGYYGLLFKTIDGGYNWEAILTGDVNSKFKNYDVKFYDENKGVVVGSDLNGGVIYTTSNGGTKWDTLHFPTIKYLYSVAFLNENEIVVTGYGEIILKSNDGGQSFVEANINGIPSSISSSGIKKVDFFDENNGVAVGSKVILSTVDGGNNWNYILPPSETSTYSGVEVLSKNHWVTFSSKSIYETTDAGNTWINIEDSLSTETINDIKFNEGLWVVGNDGVVLSYKEYTDVESNSFVVENFRLEQNYPNPFNPSTNISFYINKESKASLIVYNSLGQKVRELLNEFLPEGSYNVTFNAQGLSSGVYYYTLRTSESSFTKKMILLK